MEWKLQTWWRDHRHALYSALVVALVVWVGAWFMPRRYEATASLRCTNQKVLTNLASRADVNLTIPAPQQELTSRPVLEAVIDNKQLPYTARFDRTKQGELTATGRAQRNKAIDDLANRIQVRSDAADLVAVTVRDRDAAVSAKLANAVVDHYLLVAADQQCKQVTRIDGFLAQQIEKLDKNLTTLRSQKAQLEHDNPALANSEASAAHDAMIAARAELGGIEQQLGQLDHQHEALGRWIEQQPEQLEQRTRGRNPKVAQLQAQLAQLNQQLNEHRYKWGRTDEHPLVKKTLQQLTAVENQLKSTPLYIDLAAQRQTNPARLEAQAKLETLDAQRKALTARRDTLTQQVQQYDAQQLAAFAGRNEYDDVMRQLTDTQRQLDDWRQRRRDLAMAQSAGTSLASAMDRALPPQQAAFPPTGAGTVLALTAGLIAVLLDMLRRRGKDLGYHDLEAAQQDLNLAVLGTIAEFNREIEPRQRWWRKAA